MTRGGSNLFRSLGFFNNYIKIYIKLTEKRRIFSSAPLEDRHQQKRPRAAYRTKKPSVLRALGTETRSSSRRSLWWKDSKSNFQKSMKISANSNGWISLGDTR